MNILTIVTIGFLLMEAANVATLYFNPGSKLMNGVGIFNAWEKSKSDPEIHNFIKYLVNWVAGAKLIFIMLLVVILLMADDQTLTYTAAALVISIASFFWRLFPLIRKMDGEGQISPQKYSTMLSWMIAGFILVFLVAFVISISAAS